ncbi:MAG: D-2-hydroxyacid dehydrogenase [Acutalibacteraceae bacterium]|nr:D-2-hydroxyacid dehydrogenase [Acutalibacteraceae bacterium]
MIIAVIKKCLECEKNIILSSVEKNDEVLFFDNEDDLIKSEDCENIDVVFGEPEYSTILLMKNLRWIQMTWAGANKYTSITNFPERITLTSASGAYGYVIAEYIICGILALYKNLFQYRLQMKNGGWNKIEGNDTLEGKKVLILGTGNIGQETAKKLRCFGAYTIGIGRTTCNKQIVFDETYTVDNLDSQLQGADIVIIALPGTAETTGMFDSDRIKKMKTNAIIVNVGRGFIVNTNELTKALQNGLLRGAVLDVTEPEPLPENHPLRYMDNVLLTPHISGISWGENHFTRKRILDIFCENIQRDKNNEPKKNLIDFTKGY